MALKKAKVSTGKETEKSVEALLQNLDSDDVEARRQAARGLSGRPKAVEALCRRATVEQDASVRETIFTAIIRAGGEAAVAGLVPMLRSDDAGLRNEAIVALKEMAQVVEPYMEKLLHDAESDVRIFAINVLEGLRHTKTPQWLREVVRHDPHINVCATAVDLLSEVGTPEMVPDIEALNERFNGNQFMGFAVKMAVRRIQGT